MSAAGGQDDQRLVGEVTEGGSLLARGRRLEVLVDRAAKRAWGGVAGADLVPGPWRQAAEVGLGVQAAQTQSSCGLDQRGDTAHTVGGAPWPGDGVPGFAADAGAVESTSTMPATSSG